MSSWIHTFQDTWLCGYRKKKKQIVKLMELKNNYTWGGNVQLCGHCKMSLGILHSNVGVDTNLFHLLCVFILQVPHLKAHSKV